MDTFSFQIATFVISLYGAAYSMFRLSQMEKEYTDEIPPRILLEYLLFLILMLVSLVGFFTGIYYLVKFTVKF